MGNTQSLVLEGMTLASFPYVKEWRAHVVTYEPPGDITGKVVPFFDNVAQVLSGHGVPKDKLPFGRPYDPSNALGFYLLSEADKSPLLVVGHALREVAAAAAVSAHIDDHFLVDDSFPLRNQATVRVYSYDDTLVDKIVADLRVLELSRGKVLVNIPE